VALDRSQWRHDAKSPITSAGAYTLICCVSFQTAAPDGMRLIGPVPAGMFTAPQAEKNCWVLSSVPMKASAPPGATEMAHGLSAVVSQSSPS
jgi:hypothetical protein